MPSNRPAEALRRHLAGGPLRVAEPDRLVVGWFADLAATRTYHASGPNPISFAEIEAYARLHRWPIEPRHVEAIRALDSVWLAAARTKSDPPGQPPRTASAPISPALFDAIF